MDTYTELLKKAWKPGALDFGERNLKKQALEFARQHNITSQEQMIGALNTSVNNIVESMKSLSESQMKPFRKDINNLMSIKFRVSSLKFPEDIYDYISEHWSKAKINKLSNELRDFMIREVVVQYNVKTAAELKERVTNLAQTARENLETIKQDKLQTSDHATKTMRNFISLERELKARKMI